MKDNIIEMKPGKIYYLSYGGTEVVGRYKGDDACNYFFYDYLHQWAGYEPFRQKRIGGNQGGNTNGEAGPVKEIN